MGLDVTFYKYDKNLVKEMGRMENGNYITIQNSYFSAGKKIAYFRKPWQYFIGWWVASKDTDEIGYSKDDKAEMAAINMDASMGDFYITKLEMIKAIFFALSNTNKPYSHDFGFYERRKWEYLAYQLWIILSGPWKMCISYSN